MNIDLVICYLRNEFWKGYEAECPRFLGVPQPDGVPTLHDTQFDILPGDEEKSWGLRLYRIGQQAARQRPASGPVLKFIKRDDGSLRVLVEIYCVKQEPVIPDIVVESK